MKRVKCLYRVSTKKQVDKNTADIPMQKNACRAYAKTHPEWVIIDEREELGISGSKVSAKNRDEVIGLQESAKKREFDVLLVFMFDRIGRIDDETPHIVEWFIRQGIEVWSVKEGEQKLESHSDKLINYIRYWQAAGESQKLSMRVSERMHQMMIEGLYTGGSRRFGYELVDSGMVSRKGDMIKKYTIGNGEEAKAVIILFDLVKSQGLGSYQAARYMNERKIRYKGKDFTATAVKQIVTNPFYAAHTPWGETSPQLEELRLVSDETFVIVSEIYKQRENKNRESRTVAFTMRGSAMLAGNIYCGHCGHRLSTTVYRDQYVKKDGSVSIGEYTKYVCYYNTNKRCNCDGQGTYKADIIDNAVIEIVKKLFEGFDRVENEEQIKEYLRKKLMDSQEEEKLIKMRLEKNQLQLKELRKEIGKSLIGESLYDKEDLTVAINEIRGRVEEDNIELVKLVNSRCDQEKILQHFLPKMQEVGTWADEFDKATKEQRKLICCKLFKRIEVKRGYEISIQLNTDYEDFFAEWGGENWNVGT